MTIEKRSIKTADGVRLNVLEAGRGKPLVLIPGWSQTAAQFRRQLEGLSDRYRVIAIDMRGHGDSDKPAYGYRIQRLAQDVRQALVAMDLQDVTILGHSMGCSVLWCYFDLFGAERISKFVFCDEPPMLTADPTWTAQQAEDAGAIFTPEAVTQTMNALAGPDGVATTTGFVGGMVTSKMPPETLQWMIAENLKLPRAHAATLLYNHCHQDWRDVFARIDVPSLFIGGRVSLVPWKSVAWAASQVKGARLEIFEEAEGGQHFMFEENPARFNRILAEFIG
ncbi:MAG: alpha/beta hydrolase [Burkholderiales bacterium]|nr:alpha/beta hydrolase [Burkholderiales bacterium]